MNVRGENDLLVAAATHSSTPLDALGPHLDAVILIGAQAIYLHTGDAPVALAEATKDSDLALDTRSLGDDPLIEDAMRAAGFRLNDHVRRPGVWVNAYGIPVDLMVPETLAGGSGRLRAARRAHPTPLQVRHSPMAQAGTDG
ncbi:MAG: hypothetical protein GEV11_29940 [Streptosporangiales bacterium]|nr:hypothetical protein [Streptosporangiales bacterium]